MERQFDYSRTQRVSEMPDGIHVIGNGRKTVPVDAQGRKVVSMTVTTDGGPVTQWIVTPRAEGPAAPVQQSGQARV